MMRLCEIFLPRAALAILCLLVVAASAGGSDGLNEEYCSTENTGSDYTAVYNEYQSNGACKLTCDGYAFAILQDYDCWCSNYAPSVQEDTSYCNQTCPGYGYDLCGNSDDGLYGYIPIGTASGTAAVASSTTQASSTYASATTAEMSSSSSIETSATTEQSTSTYAYSSTSSSTATSTSASSTVAPTTSIAAAATSQTSAESTQSPVTSTRVVTVSGAVVTQTVTSTPVVVPGESSSEGIHRASISHGAVAGIVVAVLAGLAAIAVAGLLLWRRKQRQHEEIEATGAKVGGKPKRKPRRNVSVLSKAGLLSRGNHDAEKDFDDSSPYNNNGTVTGTNSVRHSMLFGAGGAGEGVSPVSPLGEQDDGNRHHSRPMVYDQRLNPSALFANHEANGSRVSMQDAADYSRPLGVTNPDIRESFESRISRP